jgi:hypothetical protein
MSVKLEDGEIVCGYVTKYALTKGIMKVKAEVKNNRRYVSVKDPHGYSLFVAVGKDFFLDKATAEARARRMAAHKISSLRQQLAKLKMLAKEPRHAKVCK